MLNVSATLSRRTTIQPRDFTCNGSPAHSTRMIVRLQVSDDGQAIERSAEFMYASGGGTGGWQPLPICPACGALASETGTLNMSLASVPAAERVQVWLSPDGQRVAIPGRRDAMMPERYRVAGYRTIEAGTMRDLARIESIRERQVGEGVDGATSVVNEMNYDPETRQWLQDRPYDEDGRD